MKTIRVILGRLVREEKIVDVDVADDFPTDSEDPKAQKLMQDLYENEDGDDGGWEADNDWGCEEGTHYIVSDDPTAASEWLHQLMTPKPANTPTPPEVLKLLAEVCPKFRY